MAAFGSDWYTRIDQNTGPNAVLWAVTGGRIVNGGGDPANILYSTNPSSTPWPRNPDALQSFTTSLIAAMGNNFAGNQPTANNPMGLIQNAQGSVATRNISQVARTQVESVLQHGTRGMKVHLTLPCFLTESFRDQVPQRFSGSSP